MDAQWITHVNVGVYVGGFACGLVTTKGVVVCVRYSQKSPSLGPPFPTTVDYILDTQAFQVNVHHVFNIYVYVQVHSHGNAFMCMRARLNVCVCVCVCV